MEDETLEQTASEQEQPVQEAVAQETQEAVAAPDATTEQASAETEQPSFTTRAWAGKYQSPEELERAYLESQREASRMAGELSAMKKAPTAPQSAEPKWKQLEETRNRWAQHYRNPNLSESERIQADDQVRLYDREIAYERAKHEFETVTTRRTAEQQLDTESLQVLQHYQTDLQNMSSPLYQAASSRFNQLVQAGYPETNTTKALAVAYAAAQTGRDAKAAVQQDRGKLLKSLNTTMKKAVVAGAGGPAAVKSGQITGKDIDQMSEKEFAEYERKLLLGA